MILIDRIRSQNVLAETLRDEIQQIKVSCSLSNLRAAKRDFYSNLKTRDNDAKQCEMEKQQRMAEKQRLCVILQGRQQELRMKMATNRALLAELQRSREKIKGNIVIGNEIKKNNCEYQRNINERQLKEKTVKAMMTQQMFEQQSQFERRADRLMKKQQLKHLLTAMKTSNWKYKKQFEGLSRENKEIQDSINSIVSVQASMLAKNAQLLKLENEQIQVNQAQIDKKKEKAAHMSECIISNKDLLRHWLMDIEHVLLASEWIMREIAVSEEELAEEINLIAEIRSKIFSRRVRISQLRNIREQMEGKIAKIQGLIKQLHSNRDSTNVWCNTFKVTVQAWEQ